VAALHHERDVVARDDRLDQVAVLAPERELDHGVAIGLPAVGVVVDVDRERV
jgi:hypothetical protein